MHEALDYAQASPGSLTLSFGPPGVGKSAAARNWCEQRPGVARYIETPAIENERGFYSAVAEEPGIPRGSAYNGQQTSLRIIDSLKTSRVARHCLPEGDPDCHELLVRYAQASRVNLSAITETIRAARFLARKSGRAEAAFTDLQDAIARIRSPMDWLLAADPAHLCADG